jgi:putative hydrolase of the HAD superfamily
MSRILSAVLFDFAGVITQDPFRVMGAVAAESGIAPADFAAIAVGRGDYGAGDHPWHQLERGEIEVADYNRLAGEMARSRGLDGFPPLPVERILEGALVVRPEMLALLDDLRAAGIATAIVTNNVRALGAWRELADWDGIVDVVVDSCEVGMRKPEPGIFHHACSALRVEPRSAVFLDDMQANVDGATEVGLSGILVTDPTEAIAQVRDLTGA